MVRNQSDGGAAYGQLRKMAHFDYENFLCEILLQYLAAIIGQVSRAQFLLITGLDRTQSSEKLIAPCGALVVAQEARLMEGR